MNARTEKSATRAWIVPIALIALTFLSTLYVGAQMVASKENPSPGLAAGIPFALPLMAILLAHEFGHFIAGKIHGVDISPPFFIPAPIFLLGTMGAVIRIRSPIRNRNALLDVGAAGPLAGFCVAVPVLAYGLATSQVEPIPPANSGYIMEGRSALYLALLYLTHGPIPEGRDIFLSPTAFAGWAGLLVTMINLIPVGQLDGGHVAYALFGKRQNVWSERIRRGLPLVGIAVSAGYTWMAYASGKRGDALMNDALAGVHWLVWALVLWIMTRQAGREHPPTGSEPLSPTRRWIAAATLIIFAALFMPSWVRQI